MKRKSTKPKRSTKSGSQKYDPFVSGEWIIIDNPKVDRTIRPTQIKNLKELVRKYMGDPPPSRKKKK